jgi:hypothetical protein
MDGADLDALLGPDRRFDLSSRGPTVLHTGAWTLGAERWIFESDCTDLDLPLLAEAVFR